MLQLHKEELGHILRRTNLRKPLLTQHCCNQQCYEKRYCVQFIIMNDDVHSVDDDDDDDVMT